MLMLMFLPMITRKTDGSLTREEKEKEKKKKKKKEKLHAKLVTMS